MLPKIDITEGRVNKFLLMQTEDHISNEIRSNGSWADFEAKLCIEVCAHHQDRFSVLDIGANLGGFTLPVATAIQRRGGVVHAFEAQRIVFQQLNGNVFLNRLDNVYTHFGAVSDESGLIELPSLNFEDSQNVGGFSIDERVRLNNERDALGGKTFVNRYTGPIEPIPFVKIDDLNPSHIAFIKIDVEGMEYQVIKGMMETIDRNKFPPILFEVWVDKPWFNDEAKQLIDLVTSLGYDLWSSGRVYLAQHSEHPISIKIGP